VDALRSDTGRAPIARVDDLRTIEPELDGGRPLGAKRIERRRIDGHDVVVKSSGRRPRADLRREATVLAALRSADVVELIEHIESDDADELRTVDAGRSSLADPWSGSSSQRSATFASACTALANLHARGWFHGAVALDHVVVAGDGSVRWCSLGSAGRAETDPSGTELDRVALMRAAQRVARTLPRSQLLRRQLARLGDRPDPRRLARLFRRWSSSRTRFAARPAKSGRGAAHFMAAPSTRVAVGCVLFVIVVVVLALAIPRPSSLRPGDASEAARVGIAASSQPAGPAPTPSRPEVIVNGVRRSVGRPDDVPFVVDRDCDGREDLVVLRPSTGEVFDFPTDGAVPTATSSAGRRVIRVPGARGFASQSDCGPPGVQRDDGSVLPVLSP
jgi:hypothetical protein